MKALAAHAASSGRGRLWFAAGGVAVVAIVVTVVALLLTGGSTPTSPSGHSSSSGSTATHHARPLSVVTSTPAAGAQGVASDATLSVTFSAPVTLGSVQPTLSPPVAGTWQQTNRTTITDALSAPLIPSTTEVLTVPGGPSGVKGTDGGTLPASDTIQFTIAVGDTGRLQEMLAVLNYLPLSFTPSGGTRSAAMEAMPQLGTFAWRWTMPTSLTSLWVQGSPNVITKAAVMQFEKQNNLTVDGLAGPQVWAGLFAAVAAQKLNPNPYEYVVVNKVVPQSLTLYDDGTPKFTGIPVNTGAPGADTVDGTFPVFEHVVSSEMKGTNPDGSKYDDPNVPWASYFNGGDALHGFPRAHYGYPQSNGCVEMMISDAQMLWPYTPIGTLVTVVGPSTGAGPQPPPPTTTTTTAPPPPPPTTTTVAG
ncbi:MAG TPA: L,D-transpeptidase family protein [Acidimicrobiales bacterium]|nr:L,D-transpeptidase family protein [Acidimicrobiales bacterium]